MARNLVKGGTDKLKDLKMRKQVDEVELLCMVKSVVYSVLLCFLLCTTMKPCIQPKK